MQNARLKAIEQYQNGEVISRFTDMYAIDQKEAVDLFQETKKFLYISPIEGVFIPDDLLILDEMWHNFILFTAVYHEFCKRFFDNKFLHHLPASKKEKESHIRLLTEQPELAREEYLRKMEKLVSIVYDHLGEKTVKKWFQIYPKKYSKENIKALRK
ncbi:hypothetical protein AAG747_12680 [Rapidithrix thailandica]|uniref:Uncharacterized protein n=1 Tax=Rapidithrix thailandica TaxID=413964 RepID=A0AAW9S4G9_9BACT